MATIRRNTYVLPDRLQLCSQPGEPSGMDRQNLMRLKVNRIALVQELRVEHIISHLIESGVIKVEDLRKIETGSTAQDRTRLFIDILASKKKKTEWYKHFRQALFYPNADNNTCKKYRCLVEFLDNTIIHRPTSQGNLFKDLTSMTGQSLSKFNPLPPIGQRQNEIVKNGKAPESPNILKIHENDEINFTGPDVPVNSLEDIMASKSDLDIVPHQGSVAKGFINHLIPIPADFHSSIIEPTAFLNSLRESDTSEDQETYKEELKSLEEAQNLEVMCYLYKRRKLPDDIELCQTEVVEEILARSDHYHRLTKYIRKLMTDDSLDLLCQLTDSYQHVIVTLSSNYDVQRISHTITLGLKLTDFLMELNYNDGAERTLIAALGFMAKHPKLETLMPAYKGYVKLMQLKNKDHDFKGSNNAYNRATEMVWQIEKASFGQDLIEKGEMFLELSHLMLECGSINSAYDWGFKALQHVGEDDKANVVNVLCNAVMTYCSKWNIKRAELLAVQAVQFARKHFGTSHPLYLKSLLTYCYYSNEFRQDKIGVDIAQLTLDVSRRVYGIETPQMAHAHRALCKALIVAENVESEEYLYHAKEAMRIAGLYFPPSHPTMYLFHFTMAVALQCKAHHVSFSEQEEILRGALAEAEQAQTLIVNHFGDTSLRYAQILGLLGQISTKLGRIEIAESALVHSEKIMSLCLPSHNNYLLVARATLGMFYSMNPNEHSSKAKALLTNVINTVGKPGVHVQWVVLAFIHLISLHQSDKENKEAKLVDAKMEEWTTNNPPFSYQITPTILMEEPKPYPEFLENFNIWQKRVERLKSPI